MAHAERIHSVNVHASQVEEILRRIFPSCMMGKGNSSADYKNSAEVFRVSTSFLPPAEGFPLHGWRKVDIVQEYKTASLLLPVGNAFLDQCLVASNYYSVYFFPFELYAIPFPFEPSKTSEAVLEGGKISASRSILDRIFGDTNYRGKKPSKLKAAGLVLSMIKSDSNPTTQNILLQ